MFRALMISLVLVPALPALADDAADAMTAPWPEPCRAAASAPPGAEAQDPMQRMQDLMMAAHGIADPDLQFLCGMIPHHQGAIAMSKMLLDKGKDAATRQMAEDIIAAQTKEIAEMTAMLSAAK